MNQLINEVWSGRDAVYMLLGVLIGALIGNHIARRGELRMWAALLQGRMTTFRQFLFEFRDTVERALAAGTKEEQRELLTTAWMYFNEDWKIVKGETAAYLRFVPTVRGELRATLVAQSKALEHAVRSGDPYDVRNALRAVVHTVDRIMRALDDVIGLKDKK